MYRLLSQSLQGAFVLPMNKILLYTVIYEKLQDFSLQFTFYNYVYILLINLFIPTFTCTYRVLPQSLQASPSDQAGEEIDDHLSERELLLRRHCPSVQGQEVQIQGTSKGT